MFQVTGEQDKYDKGNKRKVVVARNADFVLLIIKNLTGSAFLTINS